MNDSLIKVARMNYSTSVSSHNTLQDTNSPSGYYGNDKKVSTGSKENDNLNQCQRMLNEYQIKGEAAAANKHFKTIGKFYEAKQKAQLIDDQYIRQSQFIKDDEDEEANFQELYDVLKSHV